MSQLILRLCVCYDDPEIKKWYEEKVKEHNLKVDTDPHPDSGFDLCLPLDCVFTGLDKCDFIDFQVKGNMIDKDGKSYGFYMYPRSSISKTPLILANSVGIIDSGYRGTMKGGFRNMSQKPYSMSKMNRIVQICSGDLSPFKVELCDILDDSTRGTGGFGSTGV